MINKRIKDLTIKERQEICNNNKCDSCPFAIWPAADKAYTVCGLDEEYTADNERKIIVNDEHKVVVLKIKH